MEPKTEMILDLMDVSVSRGVNRHGTNQPTNNLILNHDKRQKRQKQSMWHMFQIQELPNRIRWYRDEWLS